ncbi:group III truncated hemoglobin [Pseudopedobacter beijingensis]|uniref:Group III truncated hemoglobin n=1 Tax=Pseudopedobacter beijingensis TaxID=1207056 RepID=A0ABW4I7Y5_9SPHI
MKNKIETMDDIKLLVDTFYEKVGADKILGPIFNDIAHVNWDNHLPVMYKFWASTLLGEMGYKGNPMDAHFKLNEKQKLLDTDFNIWKQLFIETVDELFEGEIADTAKRRAVSIADLMFFKIQNYEQSAGINIGKIRK